MNKNMSMNIFFKLPGTQILAKPEESQGRKTLEFLKDYFEQSFFQNLYYLNQHVAHSKGYNFAIVANKFLTDCLIRCSSRRAITSKTTDKSISGKGSLGEFIYSLAYFKFNTFICEIF